MKRLVFRCLMGCVFLASLTWNAAGQATDNDLADFRTVDTAIAAQIARAVPVAAHTPGYLGIHLTSDDKGRLVIADAQADSPAVKAGLVQGDIVVKWSGQAPGSEKPGAGAETTNTPESFRSFLLAKSPGDAIYLEILRKDKPLQISATLAAASKPLSLEKEKGAGPPMGKAGWDTRGGNLWKKDFYRLAVVPIEFSDVKHNEKITTKDWETSLFTRDVYNKKSVTGQTVYGSMNDYYHEVSYGTFRVEGKVFDFVKVGKDRASYGKLEKKDTLLIEALDKLLERDGKEALAKFDGIFFMYAGSTAQTVRGGLFWPHKASFSHQGKRWPYFICAEGGAKMGNISVVCHEFGHMLGLPDLYARPENPGSAGLGAWCVMSNDVNNGRPQHFSAWCKERLGWIKPTVIDPTTPQKLILAPVYKSAKECFKVLVQPDAKEYLLLENRNHKGFDASLPGEGLVIWRVVRGKPTLEESHGVSGPTAPRVYPPLVPYPSKSNDAFTPFTMPNSRSRLGEGLPVHITNIRRLDDGRISFYVGYEFY